jgi:hypothetical protein
MYCGEPADQREHVFPKSIVGENTPIVWACKECNCIAGAILFDSISEKRAHIQARLRQKYAWVFRVPQWDDDEIAELGPAMRAEVRKSMRIRKWITKRLRFDKTPIALVAEKLLEKAAIGSDFAPLLADLPPTKLRELRLLISTDAL